MRKSFAAIVVTLVSGSAIAEPVSLRVLSMQSNDTPKKALLDLAQKFEAENPDIKIKIETVDHEAFKANVVKQLNDSKTDVITWHAGNRSRVLAEKGLLAPLDDAIKNVNEFGAGVLSSVTFKNKLYGMPHAYYHWTLYYNKDVFKQAGVEEPPKDWKGFLAAVNAIKAKGIVPIALGTKESWPTGGWFDFIGMNSYGYDTHMKLCAGEISYLDPKVKSAFGNWTALASASAFPTNHKTLTWQDAGKMLIDGKAGMMLQGNFWIGEMKVPLQGSALGSMKFPTIDAKQAHAGIAPTDILAVSNKSKHKAEAKKFMAFVARTDVQEANAKTLSLLPPNSKAKVDEADPFSTFGYKLLNEAKGISQFFDREADPEVARVGMDVMVELIDKPGDLEKGLARLDATRKRVHRK
jgi:multiple sugar transport system substrate-binding protein